MNLFFNSGSITLIVILSFLSINKINGKEIKTRNLFVSEQKNNKQEVNIQQKHNLELTNLGNLRYIFFNKSKIKDESKDLNRKSSILTATLNPKEFKKVEEIKNNQETKKNNNVSLSLIEKSKYLLGPGDKIKILFYEPEILTNQFEIMANGNAVIPYLGSIKLNNHTLQSAKEKINDEMRDFVIEPIFDLILEQPRPIRITLVGELNNPGVYTLPFRIANYTNINNEFQLKAEGQKYQPTIIDALQISGGINLNSNLEEIELNRRFNENNKLINKSININLVNLFIKGDLDNNILLFDGDVIKVKKTINQSDEIFKIVNANLTPKTIPIYVVGEVKSPGLITVPSNSTLIDSILMAGGPLNSRASKSKVRIIRAEDNGSISRKNFKVNYSNRRYRNTNPVLKKDDIIFVQPTSLAKVSDALDTITGPIRNTISIYALFKLIEN